MSNPDPFQMTISTNAKKPSLLVMQGRVTVSSATALHDAAKKLLAGKRPITIDCSKAEYIDASIMQIILSLGRDLSRRKTACDLKGIDGPAKTSFRFCGIGE